MKTLSFVGAGPGAYDLITLRGLDRLSRADIVVWASSLVPEELLIHVRRGVKVYDSATMTLEDTLDVYRMNPDAAIVRLHSGDPSVYGAIQEQIEWCLANNRPFEIVPGVTSVTAAAAALGRELTIPSVSQSLVITRVARRTKTSVPDGESLANYARVGGTIAILLSASVPDEVQAQLLCPGSRFTPETPAAIAIRVGWPTEQLVKTTVGQLALTLRKLRVKTTVTVIVGEALRKDPARSHLYSPRFSHLYRLRSPSGETSGVPRPVARQDREKR
jgi:precorrin-4/cobalt-precorrin-4 C11-methyltransferase